MEHIAHDETSFVRPAEVGEMELYHAKTWLGKYVFSQDAKTIAIQYAATAIAIGMVALVLSWVMRLQLAWPNTFTFIDPAYYLQAVTMHGMIMVVYLLTALFLGGFGNYLIPLMVGARDMVFPWLNMISFWVYFTAVVLLAASFFVGGGSTGAGWTLYPPQAILPGTPGSETGILLMLASLAVFLALFAFPALFVSAIMMSLDVLLGTSFFMPAIMTMGNEADHVGGNPLLFQHLFWFFGHPEVYIVALPAFGIVSDLISIHARKNIFGYRMMVWAIIIIGALSFVVWAHHMYVSGMNPYFGFFFATTTLIIAVPTALKVYNWVLTLWQGNIHLTIPMLFSIAFLLFFINGGMTGLFLGNASVSMPLSDTLFVVAHFHMVMAVAPVMVVCGAIYHWYPKITGRWYHEGMARFHFWVTFVGSYLVFLPMHYLGIMGVPRRYFEITGTSFLPDSAQTVNASITIAALVVGFAQLVFLYNLIFSAMKGQKAPGNPWNATSLEWQTEHTPPQHGNFGKELPCVYRWAYDFSVPGVEDDFIPQNVPPRSTTSEAAS